jgi:hypothetical protein
MKITSSIGRWAGLSFLVMLLGIVVVYRTNLVEAVKYIDRSYLGENLKDMLAVLVTDEDWTDLPASRVYDYNWLKQEENETPLKIAHALGSVSQPNTIAAYNRAARQGYKFFEVDLWFDEQLGVICHHGPELPDRQNFLGCTLAELLSSMTADQYLVLDIKTDFVLTSRAVMDVINLLKPKPKIIFQLYQPSHLAHFNQYYRAYPLVGPVVTVYTSHRSIPHIAKNVKDAGVEVLTVPFPRLFVAQNNHGELNIFTHPIRSCQDWGQAMDSGVKGVYIKSNLDCVKGKDNATF